MSLGGVLDALLDETTGDPALRGAVRDAQEGSARELDLTAPQALRPFIVAALARAADRPVLAVTATGREAEDLVAALDCLLPPGTVAEFPAWETLPHERLSPRSDTVGRRLAVLRRLVHPEASDSQHGPLHVVVAPVRSVLQPQVKGLADLEPIRLRAGDEVSLDDIVRGPRGGCLHAGRPGGAARRVRGARRHRRRVPADRRAPGPGGALG